VLSKVALEGVLGMKEPEDVDYLLEVCGPDLILEGLVLAERVFFLHLLVDEQSEVPSACVWQQVAAKEGIVRLSHSLLELLVTEE